jgi:hypothetical protein
LCDAPGRGAWQLLRASTSRFAVACGDTCMPTHEEIRLFANPSIAAHVPEELCSTSTFDI